MTGKVSAGRQLVGERSGDTQKLPSLSDGKHESIIRQWRWHQGQSSVGGPVIAR